MFAAFAERYQIWAAGAHPLVGAAARRGGVRGDAGKRRGEKRGRQLEVKTNCGNCNSLQSVTVAGKSLKRMEIFVCIVHIHKCVQSAASAKTWI